MARLGVFFFLKIITRFYVNVLVLIILFLKTVINFIIFKIYIIDNNNNNNNNNNNDINFTNNVFLFLHQ